MKMQNRQFKFLNFRKLVGRLILGAGYLSLLIITTGSIQKPEVAVSLAPTDFKEVVWKE